MWECTVGASWAGGQVWEWQGLGVLHWTTACVVAAQAGYVVPMAAPEGLGKKEPGVRHGGAHL